MAKNDPPRVLMDSCAFIAIIKDAEHADRLDKLLDLADQKRVQIVESTIILGEVYKQSEAEDEATRIAENLKLANIRERLESREVQLLDVTPPIIKRATEYRLQYGMKLPDAVHVATAVLNRCDWLVTLEKSDRKWPDLNGIRTFRLEHLQNPSFSLPWDLPIQDALPSIEQSAKVIPLRPSAGDGTVG